MKLNIICLNVLLSCAVVCCTQETIRIINNTNQPLRAEHLIPIYSRTDTQINPIKSQQELQDILHEAILNNSAPGIINVVRAGADVNLFKDGKAPLMWATILKKFNSVEVLKKLGAKIPCPKNMLYRAILNDSPEEVRQALQAGVKINENIRDSKDAIAWATSLARYKVLEVLLEHVDYNGGCAHTSLKLGDIKSALLSIRKTSAVWRSEALYTLTFDSNRLNIFQYVVQAIDPTNIMEDILEFLQELIKRGYDINSSSYSNGNPMGHESAWVSIIKSPYFSTRLIDLLMRNGATPNQLIHNGSVWTPLFLAIDENNTEVVKYLLEVGADVHLRIHNSSGLARPNPHATENALEYAERRKDLNNHEIIELIRKHSTYQ